VTDICLSLRGHLSDFTTEAKREASRSGPRASPGEPPLVVTVKTYASPYVAADAGALVAALVLRPSAAVDQLPPIKGEPSPIADRAAEQHAIFVRTLRDRGVTVHEIHPHTESPTETLVADCAIVLPHGAVIARPSQYERRAEVVAVEKRLTELGIPIVGRIEAPGLLDATDVAIAPGRVFVGVPRAGSGLRRRSNELGRRQLEAIVSQQGYSVAELVVANDVVRLRDVFSVVGSETIVAAPERVDLVTVVDMRIVEVPRGEELAAGVLALGERLVVANLRFRESIAIMRKAKISVEAIDMWEFGKAGFGPFSLALAVKRA
jgi:dimethylargininase